MPSESLQLSLGHDHWWFLGILSFQESPSLTEPYSFLFLFWSKVSRIPGWPWICYVARMTFNFLLSWPYPQSLGYEVLATIPNFYAVLVIKTQERSGQALSAMLFVVQLQVPNSPMPALWEAATVNLKPRATCSFCKTPPPGFVYSGL